MTTEMLPLKRCTDDSAHGSSYGAFVSHLDLSRAPYVLYGVKYIDLVSLGAFAPDISSRAITTPLPPISYFLTTFPFI